MTDANAAAASGLDIIGPSPLLEADPTSLDELFDRVNRCIAAGLPEEIADADIDAMVARLQAKRLRYIADGEEKAKTKAEGGSAKRKKGTPKSVAQALALDLDEL